MRVLLIRPMACNAVGGFAPIECEPLELEYLLSACREQGIEAEIYDAVTEHRRLSDVLASFRPDAVAVTGYLTQEREMARCAAQVKKYFPRCLVVLGGVHIGNNVVIGAGSVVTKDIPDGYLAFGNPCRPVRPITETDSKKDLILPEDREHFSYNLM